MKRVLILLAFSGVALVSRGIGAEPAPAAPLADLKGVRALAVGPGGKVYAATAREVKVLENGGAKPFAAGFQNIQGLAAFQQALYVCDEAEVKRLNAKGESASVFPPASAGGKPRRLAAIAANQETGQVYVAEAGIGTDADSTLYRMRARGDVSARGDAQGLIDTKRCPKFTAPRAMLCEGASHLLFVNQDGELHRLRLADGLTEEVATGFSGALAWDPFGRLYGTEGKTGRLVVINRPGEHPTFAASPASELQCVCLAPSGRSLLAADAAGTVKAVPIGSPAAVVDEAPLALKPAVAFPNLKWSGWKAEDERGKVAPLRPILLTHAGDGSNRVFVATQQGVVHVFPNDQAAAATQVFLDLQPRVQYNDATNEEGFLGLAFHPKFKDNGEFFVFYTLKNEKLTNVVSRIRVRKDDASRADPASEEELLRFKKPFWNHDGGTLCFGPDGYLYVTHGDGGLANDPYGNGQNLKSLLGKVLRIDVDRKDEGKAYAVPKDNPFVGKPDARPEIWAYGLRNIWRMAFDRKTGQLWAADVGQNLYEEIDLIEKGGNYGWNRREGLHPFGPKGTGPQPDLIDPIWEYHHDLGKSITGGLVYRGKRLPELEGAYLYADYVSGRIWALRHDAAQKRVVANRPLQDAGTPIFSFGEDEEGEAYLLTATPTGQGILRLTR